MKKNRTVRLIKTTNKSLKKNFKKKRHSLAIKKKSKKKRHSLAIKKKSKKKKRNNINKRKKRGGMMRSAAPRSASEEQRQIEAAIRNSLEGQAPSTEGAGAPAPTGNEKAEQAAALAAETPAARYRRLFEEQAGNTSKKHFMDASGKPVSEHLMAISPDPGTISDGTGGEAKAVQEEMSASARGERLGWFVRPKRVGSEPREAKSTPIDVSYNCTYVIHAHGGIMADYSTKKVKFLDKAAYSDIRFYSPVSCLGLNMHNHTHPEHANSAVIIKSSCPGSVDQATGGQQYRLSLYNEIPDMKFFGEMSEKAHSDIAEGGLVVHDGEKKLFYAGVYRCLGNNNFDPNPVIRINIGEQVSLTDVITAVRKDCKIKSGFPEAEAAVPGPIDQIINLIVSTCFSVVPHGM